jgi:hypothetical protein
VPSFCARRAHRCAQRLALRERTRQAPKRPAAGPQVAVARGRRQAAIDERTYREQRLAPFLKMASRTGLNRSAVVRGRGC